MGLDRKFLAVRMIRASAAREPEPPLREDEPGWDVDGEEGGAQKSQVAKHGEEDTEENLA